MHKLCYIPTMLYKITIKRNELALMYQLHGAKTIKLSKKFTKMMYNIGCHL